MSLDPSSTESLLAEQARYYRERAPEYEDWWYRRARFDRGPTDNSLWFAEATQVQDELDRFGPAGSVLELACGTGLWTRRLVAHAQEITAVDLSPETLDINRRSVDDPRVTYVQADIFSWTPPRTYDVCVFTFWLSHVPEAHFDAFWQAVARSLRTGGRVFFVDSGPTDQGSLTRRPAARDETMTRRLADGRAFTIVKRRLEPTALQERLTTLGWDAQVQSTKRYFIWGHARRSEPGVARSSPLPCSPS